MPKCARCKNTFLTFLDLKGHSCTKKMVHHKVKNKGEKIPHQKKRTHVYTTVAVRPPSVKKQSLLTKCYADSFLDHEKAQTI